MFFGYFLCVIFIMNKNIIIDLRSLLGDEMSMARNLIIDLIITKNVDNENLFIYTCKDRKFLYENFIKNIIVSEDILWDDIDLNIFKKYTFTDIISFPSVVWQICGSYKHSLYCKITHPLITELNNYQRINYFANEQRAEFKKFALDINYIKIKNEIVDKKFILIHHRVKNDGAWDQSISELKELIKNFINKYKIIVFTNDDVQNQFISSAYCTNNLQEYASLMHHTNCVAVISVWSGGGQLGHYCCNSKVIHYYHQIQCHSNEFDNNGKMNDIWLTSPNAFDYATFSNCERYFYKNFDSMMKNINLII